MDRVPGAGGRIPPVGIWAIILLVGLLVPRPVAAQYFGRNKVKYEDFAWRVLETPRFRVYYYEREREAATEAARRAERWYDRLSSLLRETLTDRQPLILYASHPEFSQTTAIPGEIGEGTGGVTEPFKRRIVLPMAGPLAETDHVIGHELVHAFQYELGGIAPSRPLFGTPAIARVPLWMVEGLAEYLSLGPRSALTAMWMRDALLGDDPLPTVADLSNPYAYFPYRYGHALWAYIGGRWGEESVWNVFKAAVRGTPASAISSVLHVSPDTLSAEWHAALRAEYGSVLTTRGRPADFAERLIGSREGRELNVGPALSPDGSQLLLLSSRDPFSIDLYLADATDGHIIRQLTHSALDPHYESLQFVHSAGAWAPDGDRVAIATVGGGRPALSILRASTGERLREISLPQFGEVFQPTWSPDGAQVAFVANEGGFLDLWTIGVDGQGLRRLTHDDAAELHPAWSPDGERIAFATDRFAAEARAYGLAAIDLRSGTVRALPSFGGARNINPQWAPDGGALYFIADPGGIPDVYRVRLDGSAPEPVTQVATGVSGITELSPALTVAGRSGRLVFSAFEEGGYSLYRADRPGTVAARGPRGDAAILPPPGRSDSRVVTYTTSESPLPAPSDFERRDYHGTLSLDYISQPSLGFAVGTTGSFIGGGVELLFSDMLGRHALSTQFQLQIQGGDVLNGVGLLGTYVNRAHRAYWGVVAGQVPQLTQGFARGIGDIDNDGADELIEQTTTFWLVSRQATGLVQYPFSPSFRLEFQAGVERLSFKAETETRAFSLNTGGEVFHETVDAPPCGDSLSVRLDLCEPESLTLVRPAAALVLDRTIAGPTGPLAGQRGRLEVSPSFGSITYLTVLGDYRRYQRIASPLTLAGRLLHYGRYAGDSEDQRLSQLFLGYPSLLRGYGSGSFDLSRCPVNQAAQNCSEFQVFDQLFGSRLALANAELRLSLLGPVGILSRISPVPADLVGFFDAGVAWMTDDSGTPSDERASFLGGDRKVLSSAGVGVRFNLLGAIIGELHWVHPFDRPLRKGILEFVLNTGY